MYLTYTQSRQKIKEHLLLCRCWVNPEVTSLVVSIPTLLNLNCIQTVVAPPPHAGSLRVGIHKLNPIAILLNLRN
jgi:hypothetical protein